MSATAFRKRPVIVKAIRWTGENEAELRAWTGDRVEPVAPDDRPDPGITAEVYDDLHSTWIGLKTGDWVLRGIRDEFYACDADVFAETYEPVDDAP